jgi:anti-sigma factor RsiW
MKNDTQLTVQAYLDNELSPGDARKVAELISADSTARDLFAELRQTRDLLKPENEPVVQVRDTREFYWSQIQRAIEADGLATRAESKTSTSAWWLKLLLPAAGAVGLFAILLTITQPPRHTNTASNTMSAISTPAHVIQDLSPEVSSITFRSEAEGVTVVWVTTE